MSVSVHEAQTTLESLVDQFSVSTVIAMLSDVASEKAEHIRSAWQDEGLAKVWDRMAKTLDNSYLKINKIDRGI